MDENRMSSLEMYMSRVFRLLIVAIPCIAIIAGTTFTVLHLMGFYPDVPMAAMIVFDGTCVLYMLIGILFNRKCANEEGRVRPDILKKGKVFIAILMFIQWNYISYMIPSRDFWAYSIFWVVLAAFFLDSRYVFIVICEIAGSLIVCWLLRPDELLPVKDELYIPEMALRGVLIMLCFTAIWLLTWLIEKRLTKELERIADFDTLTLLYNRRKLDAYLEHAAGQHRAFSVIMSDIDDFKRVNDTFGHACGDEVLKDVANIMRGTSTGKAVAFRYGGEELLMLVYGSVDEAVSVAEEIRKRIEENRTVYEEKSVGITMTFGVAEYAANESFEKLIKRADANLYYGKNHGKNCVIK